MTQDNKLKEPCCASAISPDCNGHCNSSCSWHFTGAEYSIATMNGIRESAMDLSWRRHDSNLGSKKQH